MACSNCGYSGAYGTSSCPNCRAGAAPTYTAENAQKDWNAGFEFGHAIVSGFVWLITNRRLSYFWFCLVWAIAAFSIGRRFGFVSEDWMVRSFGFDLFGAIVPIVIAIVFRKQIPKIMRWVWLGLIATLAGLLILKFVGTDERSVQATPASAAPASGHTPSAAQAQAASRALRESATSEITFIAPGSEPAGVVFEGVDMRLCEIDDPEAEVCQRYCATLNSEDRPGWCH